MVDYKYLLTLAKQAALLGSQKILEVYQSGDMEISEKSDTSPLTKADQAAHQAIVSVLSNSKLPILSEEGKSIPFEERSGWDYFWMVDPLDGTKEFIKRNGEFTVNIALIHRNAPVLGVVLIPVSGEGYAAVKGEGAHEFSGDTIRPIQAAKFKMKQTALRVVASRSHMSPETKDFIDALDQPQLLSKGSSLKLLMVATGEADLYPRYAPTMEWDTAAAQIIVEEAGGKVTIYGTKQAVNYNKPDLLNPWFLVVGQEIE